MVYVVVEDGETEILNVPFPEPTAAEPSLRVMVQLPVAVTVPEITVLVLLLHTEVEPDVIAAVGLVCTVTGDVVAEQPVAVSVNSKLVDPFDTPVTTPLLVTVAIEGLLLIHVPPVEGVRVTVFPMHTSEGAVKTGKLL